MVYTYSNTLYSDLYKDATGSRPGESAYAAWKAKTPDEKQAEWDYLCNELQESEKERIACEKANVAKFEATVLKIMGNGAMDRATAIKWLFDAEANNTESYRCDPDYYCYTHGLPYGYFKNEMLKL